MPARTLLRAAILGAATFASATACVPYTVATTATPLPKGRDASTWVTLELSLRAYLLLREEYPLSLPFLTKEEDHYLFHGPVANFDGVGRFVLGLIDEVRIKSPEGFIDFLRNKLMMQKL